MNPRIGIVGLGYVGLDLAVVSALRGNYVVGVDLNKEIVDKTNAGVSHIKDGRTQELLTRLLGTTNPGNSGLYATDDYAKLAGASVVVVCVPTPINGNNKPDLRFLKSACNSLIPLLHKGELIIVESTIAPGTMKEVVKPILERSGLKAGEDFFLAYCPERINPGDSTYWVDNIPRVVGGVNEVSTTAAKTFYEEILSAPIMPLSSMEAAEAVKITENTFRDINIAYVNHLAMYYDQVGLDVTEIIAAASTKPFGYMPFKPGCGVGGHCIPNNPYYIIDKAASIGVDLDFLRMAREINESMPEYTVKLLEKKVGDLKGETVGVLGVTFKEGVDDVRQSPGLKIIEILKARGATVEIYDYSARQYNTKDSVRGLMNAAKKIIVTTDSGFKDIPIEAYKECRTEIIIDGRNCLDAKALKEAGIYYHGIGRC
jgi:UDP-N-acetyl-D-glucosamine dehydrogenase